MRYLKRVAQYVIVIAAVVVAREYLVTLFLGSGSLFWVLLWSAGTGFLVGSISGLCGAPDLEGFFYGFIFWVLLWAIGAGVVVGGTVASVSGLWFGALWGGIAALDGMIGIHFGNSAGGWLRLRFAETHTGERE